jgi:membrane associated rhomboid family serine protease
VGFFILLTIVAAIGLRIATADERARAGETAAALWSEMRGAVALNREKCEPFFQALRARAPRATVTLGITGVYVLAFVWMLASAGLRPDTQTLVAWGASKGPLTTNGEWWRLASSSFIHAGIFPLLVNLAVQVQLGLVLERLVGRFTFAAVYLSAGIFATLTTLLASPMAVSAGASGAVAGLLGLFGAASLGLWRAESDLMVPRVVLKRLTPAVALFVLYNAFTGDLPFVAEICGLVAGFVCGLALIHDASEAGPSPRRMAVTAASTLVIIAAAAVPLHGITDVRPEIARLAAIEERTSAIYEKETERFRKRQITGDALAQVIVSAILPELQAADERLRSLTGVPAEDRPLAKAATDYVRLRTQSWTLRLDSLRPPRARLALKAETAPATQNPRRRTEQLHQTHLQQSSGAEVAERSARETLDRVQQLVGP